MNEQAELLKKIKFFLDSKKISYNDGSLEFIGVRKNYKLQVTMF